MAGVLLDTHALYWLVSGEQELTDEALVAIGESQAAGELLVSPITAWELAVATAKNRAANRPDLGEETPDQWFQEAIRVTQARIVPIRQKISIETARIVGETGHKDPGDCFLMATARIRRVPLVTRDGILQAISDTNPDFLQVIPC